MTAVDDLVTYLASHMEARPLPLPVIAIVLPDEDAPDTPTLERGAPEGQLFMIEYRDARGRVSSRRITVLRVDRGVGNVAILCAHCHERDAYRQFRVDRIRACIDVDGVVHEDVPRFVAATFGITAAAARRAEPAQEVNRWERVRAAIRPYAVIFSALSHADGRMTQDEVFVAAEHCREVAEGHGFDLAEADNDRIEAYLVRQRPTPSTISRACETVFEDGGERTVRFLRAALELVDVDGERHPEEVAMLNRVAEDLTGAGILG